MKLTCFMVVLLGWFGLFSLAKADLVTPPTVDYVNYPATCNVGDTVTIAVGAHANESDNSDGNDWNGSRLVIARINVDYVAPGGDWMGIHEWLPTWQSPANISASFTPDVPGTWYFRVRVMDGRPWYSPSGDYYYYAIQVISPVPVINSSLSQSIEQGQNVLYTISATNGPTSFSASNLPAGLSVNTGNGQISGRITASGTIYSTITAANGAGADSRTLTWSIAPATITPQATVSPAMVAFGQSVVLTRAGTANFGVSWTENVIWRPDGQPVVLGNQGLGVQNYTPVMTGSHSYQFRLVDSYQNYVDQVMGFSVTKAAPSVVFNNRTYNPATNGWYTLTTGDLNALFKNPYNNNATQPGGTVTYAIVGPGTSLSAGSQLAAANSYTVRASYPGDANYQAVTADAVFTIASLAPAITSPNTWRVPQGAVVRPYTIVATYSPTSYGAAGLPAGLSVNPANGEISGTPTQAGTFSVTLSATNAAGTGNLALALIVGANDLVPNASLSVTLLRPGELLTLTRAGTAYHGVSWTENVIWRPNGSAENLGNAGLGSSNYVPSSGDGTYTYQYRLVDTQQNFKDQTLTFVVDGQAPSVPASLAASSVSTTGFTLSWSPATDNVAVAAYEVRRDSTVLGTTNVANYSVTGLSPDTTYTMSVRAKDTAGNWSTWSAPLNVTTLMVPPIITSAATASTNYGVPFSYTITASGNPASYSVTGTLPTGLALNTSTGVLAGTPTQPGTFNLVIGATNAVGTGTANFQINIEPPVAQVTLTPPGPIIVGVGQPITLNVTGSHPGGLNELGIEVCDEAGVPLSNAGAIAASGYYRSHDFTWTSSVDGIYYLDGYLWSAGRTELKRTPTALVVVGSPPAQLKLAPTEPVTVAPGQLVTFELIASHPQGLNEIGLELYDAAGSAPVSNAGAVGVSGPYVRRNITWSTTTPGVYYIGAYSWNTSRTDLRRTGVTAVVVGAPPAGVMLSPNTPVAVGMGVPVTFTVTGQHPDGLNEIGLELANEEGVPVSNAGAYGVTGPYARRDFTWSSTNPGVYYFDGYIWNTGRTDLRRTGCTPVIVGTPPATAAITANATSVSIGQTVTFTVFGYQPAGLNEIGLERCSAAGTPLSNEGNVGVTGAYAVRNFTWTATADGVYYFNSYAWNAARTDLKRSSLLAITVGAGNPPENPGDPQPPGGGGGQTETWPNQYGFNDGKIVGATSGELSVDKNGAATYSVPLWVSPGTAGMEPKLALGYSSQAGSGLVGHGWSLSGASVISRGPRTKAVDGYIRGVDLTNQDAFYLDGQRLIAIGGGNGEHGTEYRTEIESFSRIMSYGIAGSGPEWFRVWTKAGLIIEFGHTSDSNFNPGSATTMSWAVNRISDTKGNYITFEYDENTADGWQHLREIKYTGNALTGHQPYASVRFTYETREDSSKGYRAGVFLSNDVRLKTIESYVGAQRARAYTLDYEERLPTRRSILKSVRETGRDGGEFPPLTFDYDTSDAGWDSTPAYAPPYPLGFSGDNKQSGAGFVDLNGDGRVDFVYHRNDTGAAAFLNTASGWSAASAYAPPLNLASTTGDDTSARFADLNGDGLPDFIWRHHGASGNFNTAGVRLNTGSGWSASQQWAAPCPLAQDTKPNYSASFLDMNGDGRVDLVAPLGGIYLNTGSGWGQAPHAGYTNVGYDWAFYRGRFVDLNGDGLPDLVVSYHGNGQTKIDAKLNTGNGWITAPNYNLPSLMEDDQHPSVGAEFADVNGDGLIDFIWYREGGDGARGLAINTGTGWSVQNDGSPFANLRSPFPLSRDGTSSPGTSFLDVNADGLVDMVMRRVLGGIRYTATNLGTARDWFGQPEGSPYYLPVDLLVSGQASQGVDFVDFDADGVVDILRKQDFNAGEAWRNRSKPADRLVKVTSGFGVCAYLEYAPLTNPVVYTKGSGSSFPISDVIAPMQVVSKVEHDDGAGGRYAVTYTYGELRSHAERGSLGFGWMCSRDARNGIESTTWFKQDYPFIGMPRLAQTRQAGGGILSESIVTYSQKALNQGKTRFPFASETIARSYELDGALMNESVTTADYDNWGNATRVEVDFLDGFEKITTSIFENWTKPPTEVDFDGWLPGRLMSSSVEAKAPGAPTQTRTSSFTYQATSGLLETETVEPNNSTLTVTTTYGYDSFGNKTSARLSAPNLADRQTATTYDGQGRFPISSTNALGHAESYSYHALWGAVVTLTGPNQLSTTWEYDQFGRQMLERRADNTTTTQYYRWPAVGSSLPAATRYFVETEKTGAPPSLSCHDAMGRVIATYGYNGGGQDGNPRIVAQETQYDAMGRAHRSSLVHYANTAPAAWVETRAYDQLNRPLLVATPDDEVAGGYVYSSIVYGGLTTETTNAAGQVERIVKNTQGQVVRRVNNAGAPAGSSERGEITYTYDAYGNLLTTTVYRENGATVTTALEYDARGRKTKMIDPDMGVWEYQYNAFGELFWQQDAKGQVVTMQYDALGRLTARTEPEGTTIWNYDTAARSGGTWLGKLASVSGPSDRGKTYSEACFYDNLGRPFTVTRNIDGSAYSTTQSYDSIGRPLVTTYPTGFKVKNVYNAFGFLKEVREASEGGLTSFIGEVGSGQLFWKADSYALDGMVDGSTFGNGLTYDRVVSPVTGRVRAITSGIGAGTGIQYHQYAFDLLGQVTTRIDHSTGRSETFAYDGLNRLTTHAVAGGAITTMAYDALGNITSKSDVGGYTYGGSAPHAVTQAGGTGCSYDVNGNMTTAGGRTQQWTSFNQLQKITQGGVTSEFWFGASYERVVQEHSNGTKTLYIGALFEKVISGGLVEEKHYILTPLGRTAVRTVRNDAKVETRYFHQDALGSLYAVTTELGAVEKRFTFDAWGKRVNTLDTHSANGGKVTRGFTDHEHLEDFGLIHMNGRVYDPVLGRFLSADPFVDDAGDSQSYNRYSYVSNNPLNHTDPSGYFKLKEGLMMVVAIVITVVVTVVTYGALTGQTIAAMGGFWSAAGTALTAGGCAGFGAVVAGGAAGGFTSGFAGSLLNGGSVGDAFKSGVIGAAWGAASAAIAFGIGQGFDQLGWGDDFFEAGWAGRAAAHGTSQGLLTEAQGGEFRHGFYASAFSSAASPAINLIKGDGVAIAGRTAAAAVVGGTGSVLGGGKFANGALTGAFTHLFNDEAARAHLTESPIRAFKRTKKGDLDFTITNPYGEMRHPGDPGNPVEAEHGYFITTDGTEIAASRHTGTNLRHSTNCHGYTFADGTAVIDNSEITRWLKTRYDKLHIKRTLTPSVGDIVIYRNGLEVSHSARVTAISASGDVTVTMASGIRLYNGNTTKITTRPVAQGWNRGIFTYEYWTRK